MTHTYAILDVSREAYAEIEAKLKAADYHHVFDMDGPDTIIDMHGIALKAADIRYLSVRDVAIIKLREALDDFDRRCKERDIQWPSMKTIYDAARDVVGEKR